MSRKLHKHPVEILVDNFLKNFNKGKSVSRNIKQIIEKASRMINLVLNQPCCIPGEEVVLGRIENAFLIQLRSLLNKIDASKWKESLTRSNNNLETIIFHICCNTIPVPVTFVDGTQNNTGVGVHLNFCGEAIPDSLAQIFSVDTPWTLQEVIDALIIFLNEHFQYIGEWTNIGVNITLMTSEGFDCPGGYIITMYNN